MKLRTKLAYIICPELYEDRRALLRRLEIDEFTGLGNKIALKKAMKSMTKSEVILVFDLNNLGLLNKVKGHNSGDRMIKLAANAIKRACGAYSSKGRPFRFGGDEFVVICDAEFATSIQKYAEIWMGSIQLSPGVIVSLSGAAGGTFDEADKGLQGAKQQKKTADLEIGLAAF